MYSVTKKDSVLSYEKKIVSYVNTSNENTIAGAATQKTISSILFCIINSMTF